MEVTPEQYERIMKFLDGDMSVEEMNDFEKELKANPEMRKQMDFEQLVRERIELTNQKNEENIYEEKNYRIENDQATRSQIEKVHKQWMEQKKIKSLQTLVTDTEKKRAKIISFPGWLNIAAACFLLLVAGTVWFVAHKPDQKPVVNNIKPIDSIKEDRQANIAVTQNKDSLNSIKSPRPKINFAGLYKKYFKKDVAPEEKPMFLAEALIDYENGNYRTLQNMNVTNLPTEKGLPNNDINRTQNIKELGHYYKGLAFIEANEDKQAMENLQWVIDSAHNKQLIIKAQWYIALIQLKKGNSNKAIAILTAVLNNKATPYSRQAKELLNILKP
jgi:hypothetical protein